jgi:hypothetical protein
MSKYIDILTLVNQCVNVVAHVAHTTAFWIKHLHYIDPQNAESRLFGLNTFHYITRLSHAHLFTETIMCIEIRRYV